MPRPLITQEKIIEAALFCAFDKGMGDTSLNDISSYLSIKKASLYNHFASKEEMLKAIYTYCSDFYTKVNLITEADLAKTSGPQIAQIEKLFKTCAVNYIKKHEVDPLFQIYAFINSEKYFIKEVLDICNFQFEKIENQTYLFFKLVNKNLKIDNPSIKKTAHYFCVGLYSILDTYLVARKETIRQNPESGVGALFALPSDDKMLQEMSRFSEFTIQKFTHS
ncbi:TetR/AcrR family transcriptional regulator [Treponema sp.]|uniref:TetR/AcrR family transcriptional regulator n=1 Tax=Treponema sp. TaxID=166 RepID=UPI00298E789C|nr:TetR/AcrR family transcriptional regulator [Treponema sp.]MCR5612968.1 TetR/AcrR family transcriptional regulator [Treponema sp.]